MRIINDLGASIAEAYRKVDYDIDFFSTIAEDAINSSNIASIDIDRICNWFLSNREITRQVNLDSKFGEPPLTVFVHDRFYIDILFWLNATTTIHQHGFRGLFYVLQGSSIHSEFSFSERIRINQHLLFGDLRAKRIELLQKGDFRKIGGGNSFIHSLFHLDFPSISLVIRTYEDPVNPIQLDYLLPHIAFAPADVNQKVIRQTQLLKMLKISDNSKFSEILENWARNTDVHTFVYCLISLSFENLLSESEVNKILEILNPKYKEFIPNIRETYFEIYRKLSILVGRKFITNPEHRFLMALLMNATCKEDVLRIISKKFPFKEPQQLLFGWIKELNTEKKFNGEFDEFQLDLLEIMFEKTTWQETVNALGELYNRDEINSNLVRIQEIYFKLRQLPMFKILFSNIGGLNEYQSP